MRKRIKQEIEKLNGFNVNTNFQTFREGRATQLAKKGLNQPNLYHFFGWKQGSDHARKYIRLAERDLEDAMHKIWDSEKSVNA